MINVGLTGNRYSGKDTVCELFKKISIPVFNADVILKFLINSHYEMQYKISKKVSVSFFNSEGDLDLKKITGPVFDEIVDIVEDELFDTYDKFKARNASSIYTIFHSSILFERDWNKKMKYNICVAAKMTDRVSRCCGVGSKILDIHSMAQKEMKEITKKTLSTFVINNYDTGVKKTYSDSVIQVNQIDQKIIDDYIRGDKTGIKNLVY